MANDNPDILETLKQELDFVEKGGYGRSVKTPWKPTSMFQDSLTCLNFADPRKTHSCSECFLIDFVPAKSCGEVVPCHHIPLNDSGDTIETLAPEENQQKVEAVVKDWLRIKIDQFATTGELKQSS